MTTLNSEPMVVRALMTAKPLIPVSLSVNFLNPFRVGESLENASWFEMTP